MKNCNCYEEQIDESLIGYLDDQGCITVVRLCDAICPCICHEGVDDDFEGEE